MKRWLKTFVLPALLAFFLTACGGGGGDSPVPTVSNNPPPAIASDVKMPDPRVIILAAAEAASAPSTGLPVTSAGEIQIDGNAQYVTFTKTPENKVYGLSDANGTYLVDLTEIDKVCANSSQVGWEVPGYASRSCGVPDENGYLVLERTCNKDMMAWNVTLKDGTILWFDHVSERAWGRKGFPSSLRSDGLIEYGNFQPATVSVKTGVGSMANLVINFGTNCMGGFGKDNKLTDLDPATPLKFLWNSPKASANGTDGWGLVPITERNTVPSVKEAYPKFDEADGSFTVTFENLACADRGNITVYKGAGPSENVVWEAEVDGFGAGWFVIQKESDPLQFWRPTTVLDPGVSLSFDREKYQIVYSLPGCPG